ncbi:MAG: tellurite resistance protein TehB [Bacteroidetes bacterium ADurb.Bin397]|nr:MAG: tellurite resistance protein TehB [Bacteroidetes bacterium ADurb.Bin397]
MTSPPMINDIFQWDVKAWSTALPFWEQKIKVIPKGNALELGGRQGGLSLWLANQGFNVICSDLSDSEVTAKPLHQKYKLANISYADIDASAIPFQDHFDVIVFKSIIGGIGRFGGMELQQKTFDSIHKALKPGGYLLFAENLIASPLHQFLRKKFVKWGDTWRYVSLSELKSFTNEFRSVEIKATGFASAFGRSESQRNGFSIIDKMICNSVVPDNWKYIAYGAAQK